MKHLIIKDRSLRKNLKNLDKKIYLSKFLNKKSFKNLSCKHNNRCVLTGRGRAVLRFFKHSRISVRYNCLNGVYPGVFKASW